MSAASETQLNAISPLELIIRDRIAVAGGIPFAEFMELCLYHPEHGYYMQQRQRIGRAGDFYTSSSVHALFGGLIARQLVQMWELLGKPERFVIAEQGAGEGHLCHDILDALSEAFPAFYACVSYHLVEISPDNRARQKQLLQRHNKRVVWSELTALSGMVGCILSNELLDAFPVEMVEMRAGALHEVFVVTAAGQLQEELRLPATDCLARHFDWLGVVLNEGCRAEVNLNGIRWIREIAGLLDRGFVLTIDYGYLAAELYAPWRSTGTLMCYYRHTSSENPYERIGEQDITAHIDFTALKQAGEECGLLPLFYGEQYRFLLGLGFVEALMTAQLREVDPQRSQALRMTLKNLILPDGGMGETFKVLVQGKGVGQPALLCARSVRDLPLPVESFVFNQ